MEKIAETYSYLNGDSKYYIFHIYIDIYFIKKKHKPVTLGL